MKILLPHSNPPHYECISYGLIIAAFYLKCLPDSLLLRNAKGLLSLHLKDKNNSVFFVFVINTCFYLNLLKSRAGGVNGQVNQRSLVYFYTPP